jgi:hypothetical protein
LVPHTSVSMADGKGVAPSHEQAPDASTTTVRSR